MSRTPLVILAILCLTLGCHHDRPASSDTGSTTVILHDSNTPTAANQTASARANDAAVMRAESMTLEQYAAAVTNAPDRASQLAALRQLWQFMRDHNYTYQLNATRLSDGVVVPTPASSTDPVQVTMTIFEGSRQLHSFNFQPMNNADLQAMTQGGT